MHLWHIIQLVQLNLVLPEGGSQVNLTQIVRLAPGGFIKNVVMMTGFIMFLNSVMKIYLGVPLYVGLPLAI